MNESSRIKVTTERNFSAHHMLINAARCAVLGTKSRRDGWSYDNLVAVTLCALSIEAICNSIGRAVIDEWNDFESASPSAKLRILCDRLQIKYERENEPWLSARWLGKLRNQIAHAKPERVKEEKTFSRDEFDNRGPAFPQSKLEKEITLENAERALWVAESIKEVLCRNVPPDLAFGLYADSSFGSASAHTDQE